MSGVTLFNIVYFIFRLHTHLLNPTYLHRRSKGKRFLDSDKKLVVFVKLHDQEKRDDTIQQKKLFEKMELDHENMLTNC